jgi:hypothetical protein
VAGRRLKALIFVPYQWRAQWRDLNQRGSWRGANVATVIVLGLLGLFAQIAMTANAVAAFHKGDVAAAIAVAEAGLTGILIGWLMLPILVHSIAGSGTGVVLQRLGQFPLSNVELFAVGALGSLAQPVYWVLMVASVVSLVPFTLTPQPLLGFLAGTLYVLAAAMIAWALHLAMSAVMASRRGREVALAVTAVLMFGSFPLMRGDFDQDGGRLTYTVMDRTYVLLDVAQQSGLLATVDRWMPAGWVGAVAQGEGPGWRLLALATGSLAGFGLSILSLRRLLTQPPQGVGGVRTRQSTIGGLPGVPPQLGVTAVKELRYLLRTLDAMLGFTIGLIATGWMLWRPEAAPGVLVLCLPIIVLNEMVMPLNAFGLDGTAVDRYRLLPLSGRQILLSKNLAFALVVAAEIVLPVLAGLWQVGVLFTLAAVCAAAGGVLLMMAWGNQVSVRSPAPRAFFNFDSKEQAGGILSMLGTTLMWGVPALVGFAGREFGGHAGLLAAEILFMLVTGTVYYTTLPSAGRAFDDRAEEMRIRLAGQS